MDESIARTTGEHPTRYRLLHLLMAVTGTVGFFLLHYLYSRRGIPLPWNLLYPFALSGWYVSALRRIDHAQRRDWRLLQGGLELVVVGALATALLDGQHLWPFTRYLFGALVISMSCDGIVGLWSWIRKRRTAPGACRSPMGS